MEPENDIVTKGNRAGEMRQDLWFLSMDQINRAIQDTDDFGQMGQALDATLGIFGSDPGSSILVIPRPERAERWQRARPELTDSAFLELDVPMNGGGVLIAVILSVADVDMPLPLALAWKRGQYHC